MKIKKWKIILASTSVLTMTVFNSVSCHNNKTLKKDQAILKKELANNQNKLLYFKAKPLNTLGVDYLDLMSDGILHSTNNAKENKKLNINFNKTKNIEFYNVISGISMSILMTSKNINTFQYQPAKNYVAPALNFYQQQLKMNFNLKNKMALVLIDNAQQCNLNNQSQTKYFQIDFVITTDKIQYFVI